MRLSFRNINKTYNNTRNWRKTTLPYTNQSLHLVNVPKPLLFPQPTNQKLFHRTPLVSTYKTCRPRPQILLILHHSHPLSPAPPLEIKKILIHPLPLNINGELETSPQIPFRTSNVTHQKKTPRALLKNQHQHHLPYHIKTNLDNSSKCNPQNNLLTSLSTSVIPNNLWL